MSPASPAPEPYKVVYAERVRRRLLSLAEVARDRGDGEAFVAALKGLSPVSMFDTTVWPPSFILRLSSI